jgi:hypothetical protein
MVRADRQEAFRRVEAPASVAELHVVAVVEPCEAAEVDLEAAEADIGNRSFVKVRAVLVACRN